MEEHYINIIEARKKNKEATKNTFKKFKKMNKKKVDQLFFEGHDKAFEKIDCLKCANCCKTTSPIFRDSDIKKLAKRFRIKTHQFITEYLKQDMDGDYVLHAAPCPFLWDNNECSVYEDRPLACKEYPHTNRKNMFQILDLTKANLEICPAVCEIVENIEPNLSVKTYRTN